MKRRSGRITGVGGGGDIAIEYCYQSHISEGGNCFGKYKYTTELYYTTLPTQLVQKK